MSLLTRRKLLKILLVLSNPVLLLAPVKGNAVGRELIRNENHISFEQFFWLSKIFTMQTDLDENIARKIFQLIMNEPYGNEHLKSVYARIKQRHILTGKDNDILLVSSDFSKGEQWFISHFLLTWYTGIYFHEIGNHNVTLKHALMYKLLDNYRLPPTYCAGAPGFWKDPPVFQT